MKEVLYRHAVFIQIFNMAFTAVIAPIADLGMNLVQKAANKMKRDGTVYLTFFQNICSFLREGRVQVLAVMTSS